MSERERQIAEESGRDPTPGGGASPLATEPDTPPSLRIGVYIGLLVVVLALVLVALNQLFKSETRSLIQDKELSLVSKDLLEQRAMDRRRLTTYDLVDAERGVYQIPVERAMDKLLADPALLQAPAGPAPASQPAAAPASQPAGAPASQPASPGDRRVQP